LAQLSPSLLNIINSGGRERFIYQYKVCRTDRTREEKIEKNSKSTITSSGFAIYFVVGNIIDFSIDNCIINGI
jgi:hypothetical protein